MAKILTYTNLLNPLARQTQEIEANTAYEILDKLDLDTTLYEVVVAKNQTIMKEDFIIKNDDIVSISLVPLGGGGGKDIIKVVAMIALVAVAPYATSAIIGATGAFGGLATGHAGYLAVNTAVMVAGSMVINAVLPTQTPSFANNTLDNIETSNTYSWSTRGNMVEQGKPVPILYGRHRVTPPQISHYIETVNNLQYLNVLYAVADGVVSIDTNSIEINGEPISNLNNVQIYTRSGENEQSVIGIFDDIKTDKEINKKLTTDWVYSNTDGNSVSGLEIGLVASQGLWHINDDGDVTTNSVKVEVQYYYNEQWIPIATSVSTGENIVGYWVKKDNTGYVKYATESEAITAVNIGVSLNTPITSATLPQNTRPATDNIFFQSYYIEYETYTIDNIYDIISSNKQEVLRKSYKVSGLPVGSYQIRSRFYTAPATGTRYGSDMYLAYLQETVTDDFTYPNTALLAVRILATDQLSGSMPTLTVEAESTISNPALVCKDILERNDETVLEASKFDEWENHCNDKNYTCNIYFDNNYSASQALELVGLLGRGNVLQFGCRWSVIIDRADEAPIQGFLFTMGNIAKDSFSEQFLPLQDRANKIEITYYDKEVNYEPQILEVSNANYDNVDNINVTNINYVGCTDREMALKYAKFLLNCSRYLTITQSFEVDTDAIACRLGDIIKVAHDVPQIGTASGRIVSATTTQITIDSEVVLEAGLDYFIEIRYNDTDEIISANIINDETTTDTFQLATELTKAPNKYDVFTFGSVGKISKKMRVINIVNTSKHRSKISCLEYIEDVYNDLEQIIPHSESDFGLKGLDLYEAISYVETSVVSNIVASWRGVSLWYDVFIDNEFYARSYKDSYKIENIKAPATYNITIKDSLGSETSKEITLLGRFAPPEAPTEFNVVQNSDVVRFSWVKSTSLDVVKYEIRTGVSWETGFKIGVVGNVDTFEWFPDFNHTYNFWIKALDNSGVNSLDAQQKLFTVSNINETLNIIYEYDGLDTVTPPCGDTTGLVFVVGTGYVVINTASYDDIVDTTYDDIPLIAYNDIPVFEGCAIDTNQVGVTKIRMLLDYSATSGDLIYLEIPDRTYEDFPFDTYEEMTVLNNVKLSYAISDDDITYSDWIEYTGIVDEEFRYIRLKYEFIDEVNGSIDITDFKGYLDVPDTEFSIKDLSVDTSASVLFSTYGYSFYDVPHISITTKTNTYGKITNITTTGFTIDSYNPTDGSALAGLYDINIKGY